jgi:hypothetical protein
MERGLALRLLLLSSLATFVACRAPPSARAAAPLIRDSAGIRIVENVGPTWAHPWEVAPQPTLTIGSAGTDSSQLLFGVVGALRLPDGSIVIANSGTQELLFFDRLGHAVRRVGGPGNGPGEFSTLAWLSRFGADSLVAMDVRLGRLSYFDRAGRFARSIRLEPSPDLPYPGPVALFGDGSLLVKQGAFMLGAAGPTRTERPEERVYRYSRDGRTAQVLGVFPGLELSIAPTGAKFPDGSPVIGQSAREFGRGTTYGARGTRYYVADNASYEVRVYDLTGGLMLLIRRSHVPQPVTAADVRALREARLARARDAAARQRLQRALERNPAPPETMPAYATDLRLDVAGNLWLREYAAPGHEPALWDVFDEAGILLGTVAMPPGLTLMDVGADYVLGLTTDENGVQYVQLHALQKGAA